MKKHLLFLFIILSSINIYSQNDNKICNYSHTPSVGEFKSSLKLNIEISEISIGQKKQKIDFQYSGKFSDESPIIEVSKDFAIRISVGKVIENGYKYYIYNMKLFRKTEDCWKNTNPYSYWTKFNLGNITNGYATGIEGSENHFGFEGVIEIE